MRWPSPGATIATWRDVSEAIERPDTVLLDTRSEGEHRGTVVRAKRGGTIPGSVHVEWKDNLTADGDFKPAAELRGLVYSETPKSDFEDLSEPKAPFWKPISQSSSHC